MTLVRSSYVDGGGAMMHKTVSTILSKKHTSESQVQVLAVMIDVCSALLASQRRRLS